MKPTRRDREKVPHNLVGLFRLGIGLLYGLYASSALAGKPSPPPAPPPATAYDLSTVPSTATIDGAIFMVRSNFTTVGTGVFDPFLSIQMQGVEQGWNNQFKQQQQQFDEKRLTTWTHDVKFGEIPILTYNGAQYLEFLLDINEVASAPDSLLSLDKFQIFVGNQVPAPNGNNKPSTAYNTTTGTLNGMTARYDMDRLGDSYIKLDYNNFHGSGKGIDMAVLVPLSKFAGVGQNDYLYLYSRFGDHFTSDAGFEEWAYAKAGQSVVCPPGTTDPNCGGGGTSGTTGTIPEPSALWLLASGLLGLRFQSKRERTPPTAG